jgi:glycosyltransferase involved in cell wall biosynthesis
MSPARRISVVVPTNNRPALLREALASIRAAEAEDLQIEIFVGDNGDNPETAAVAAAFNARHLATRAPGPSGGRNVCLEAARGEYIAFLDDDDVWLPGHLRPHLALLDARPDLDAVFSQRVWTDPELKPVAAPNPSDDPGEGAALVRRLLSGLFPQLGTMVVRARALSYAGLLDEKLTGGEDLDWALRFARRNKLGFVPHVSNYVRGRPDGSYDRLQLTRLGYDRLVFFRHATREWRVWRSPLEFARAYRASIDHFFGYFEKAARERAAWGNRRGAAAALWGAFQVLPLRALHNMLADRPLRHAVVAIIDKTAKRRG